MIYRRSKAREVALQLLYRVDLNPSMTKEQVTDFITNRINDQASRDFALLLYQQTMRNLSGIDEMLVKSAENWRLPRMAAVDRNLLRLGVFELSHQKDTPSEVVMNESIELAKRFGTAESPSFINGILDKICSTERPKPENA
ncbi:MAG: transcription antitermination factor NusB [Gemmataceae bacterium]|jgi:transcription antitermination protein NusB